MKPSPPRIPKGSKVGGRPIPKWAAELQIDLRKLKQAVFGSAESDSESLLARTERQGNDIAELYSRIGTSTPLIVWNIAVLIAIAGLGVAVAKLYGVAS